MIFYLHDFLPSPLGRGLVISNLIFIDDLILLTEATFEQMEVISRVLNTFAQAKGHKVNNAKT